MAQQQQVNDTDRGIKQKRDEETKKREEAEQENKLSVYS